MALLILVPLIGTALLLPGLARSTGEYGVFRISEPSQWVVLVYREARMKVRSLGDVSAGRHRVVGPRILVQ